MRILSIAPHVPYECIPHAGGTYLLHHLEHLARRHEVTLLVPHTEQNLRALERAPSWLMVRMVPPAGGARVWSRRQFDRARRRLRDRSLRTPALASLRAAGLHELARHADVVELHWMDLGLLLPELRRARVVTPVAVAVHDLAMEAGPSRRRQLQGHRGLLREVAERLHARTECSDLARADLVLVFKADDANRLRRAGVGTQVLVIAPYLEPPAGRHRTVDRTILFTGAMWRRENEQGVRWFLEEVWPSVLARVPDARFVVAGAGPSDRLHSAAESVGRVEITGEVASLGPFYEAAAGFVAPLFVDGGLKFKVPQAMMHGLPVVATPTAAAGIAGEAPAGALWAVTDDAATMAGSLADMLLDPARAREVGVAAARWATERFSFDRSMETVVAAYERLSGS